MIFDPLTFLNVYNESNRKIIVTDTKGSTKLIIDPFGVNTMIVRKNIVSISTINGNIDLAFLNEDLAKIGLELLMERIKILTETNEPIFIDRSVKNFFISNRPVIQSDINDFIVQFDIPDDDGIYFTGFTLGDNPNPGSYILVFLNGQEIEVSSTGNKLDAPAFFSGDNGETAKNFFDNPPVKGDKLYWNSSYPDLGIGIDKGSRISIYYLK
jgi:hypothetical protein